MGKTHPCSYAPPTAARKALADELAQRALAFTLDDNGATGPQLIAETDPRFKKLKEPLCPVCPGVEIPERALGSLIGLLTPADIAAYFARRSGSGRAFHASRRRDPVRPADRRGALPVGELAELLVSAAADMRVFFQYSSWMVRTVPSERLDAALLKLTDPWNPGRHLLVWMILQSHDQWSEVLSRRVLDGIINAGSEQRHLIFTRGGSGVGDNIHPAVISEALVTLKPWTPAHANAKRWMNKLKARRITLATSGPRVP